MNKVFGCFIALFMLLAILSSCGSIGEGEEKINVVCTSFVQYDWAREIVGECEDVALRLLVSGGKDMHSYSPSAADVVTILKSDLLIFTGGVSETWVLELIRENGLENTLSLIDLLGENVKHVEYLDGMQDAHEEHEGHEGKNTHGEIDEHVWLSLKNAALFCGEIKDALCRIDPKNAKVYTENCDSYVEKLSALDEEYETLAAHSSRKTAVVADRYPYRYLFDDYGFTCHAAFSGCSSETEASFSTVIFLAEKLDELDLGGILVTEASDKRLAETVRANTEAKNAEIYTLYSLQSVTDPEHESYLVRMKDNLEVLTLLFE